MHETRPYLEQSTFPALSRGQLESVQLNLGYLCNLSCVHCHVNAGPKRTELMEKETIDQVLKLAIQNNVKTLDLTGGAPEMNPHFRYLVEKAYEQSINIIDRCNLVILEEPGYEDLAEFLVKYKVYVVASLPCYMEDNVDKQRGNGVFQNSVSALKQLNALGYGQEGSDLKLDLVFNPQGATLPPAQHVLEKSYKSYLQQHYDIEFNHLYTITNMPIKRFGSTLITKGTFDDYIKLLVDSYNPNTLEQLMCLNTISIDWQGYVYDCDFNQMLDLPLADRADPVHITEVLNSQLISENIATRQHCYGCTAGQGSSCGGALS
ncbi:MAG: radical SAM protein [Gammaproteobacteria bacterium]|nr:MAG: radical SAM protein [Gammaproteobacteria bacterium]RLA02262.1 MAG: radical SAM protein [Gammaproteobacteria bacterium]